MKRVLITRRIDDASQRVLSEAGLEVEIGADDAPIARQMLLDAVTQYDAILCLLSDKIDEELLARATRTRMFANYAVGYDNMDVEAATKLGIALSNTPDVLTTSTAELAWALIFAAARRVCEGDTMVREGRFHGWKPDMLIGTELTGKTLGIVGAGRIGVAVGLMSQGFKMPVLYTRRSGACSELDDMGGRRVELDDLLKESDVVSIHTPLTQETRHLIGPRELSLMKRSAIFINTSRGPVVDEKALAAALRDGDIAAASLDVYENEPQVVPELLKLPNAVLLPHIGSATREARSGMARLAAENIVDFLSGHTPRTCINPDYASAQ